MTILKCRSEDLKKVLELQKISYKSEADLYNDYSIPPLTQTLGELEEEFRETLILKAVIDNKIIGSVRATIKDSTCFIGRLVVHPEYENRGIGSGLLKEVENIHIERDIRRFSLFTGKKSIKNLTLYKKRGYREVKVEEINKNLSFVFLEKHI